MQSITSLNNLDNAIRENRKRNLGENIVKYQYFRTSVILKKIDTYGFKKATLESYINSGINYIRTGKKFRQYGDFYNYIDEAINKCVQPLTPKQEEKRVIFNKRKTTVVPKDKTIGVQKVLSDIQQEAKKSIKGDFEYGVRCGSGIKIFNNEREARTFLDGLLMFSRVEAKLVEVIVREVE